MTEYNYPFLTALLSNSPTTNKDVYIELFRENLNQEFTNASDVFTIQEESPFASGEYQDVVVRINHVIDSDTGEKRGDDYKKILFKELDHFTQPGQQYKFDDNTWITYNTESIKSLTADALVKRANNTLRWLGADGGLYEVPCSIGELIKQTRDSVPPGSFSIPTPAGFFEILVQFNEKSNKIKANQRFLFGNSSNWTCFRVHGAGVQNYNNLKTLDNNSSGLIRLIVSANFVDEQTDDIINGICDVNKSVYTLSIDNTNVIGNIGKKIQLTSKVQFNGQDVTRNVVWSSDNEDIAKVDSNGLLTLIDVGGAEIMCGLKDNPAIFDTIIISVSRDPVLDYEIIITPNQNYILKGDSQTFSVYLWLNGVQQSDTFTFSLNPNTVPSANYTFNGGSGNSFDLYNKKMFLTDVLSVTCTSGTQSKTIDITLKGAF